MKTWGGTDKRDPDAIQRIDYFLRDVNAAMQRISVGQVPNGGGGTIGDATDHGLLLGLADDDHLQYALLSGRTGGQTIIGSLNPVRTSVGPVGLMLSGGSSSGDEHAYVGVGPTLKISGHGIGQSSSAIFTSETGTYEFRRDGTAARLDINVTGSVEFTAEQNFTFTSLCHEVIDLQRYPTFRIKAPVDFKGTTTDIFQILIGATSATKAIWVTWDGKLGGDGSLLTGITAATPVDHDHTGDAGDGGNLPAYVHLAGSETLTGKKTFPTGVPCPKFVGDSIGPSAAFEVVDEAGGGPHTLGVLAAAGTDGTTCILKAGQMVSTSETGTLALLGTGLLKNTTTSGALSIAAATDLPAHTHATGQGGNIDHSVVTGLDTMAEQAANNVAITGGSISGITDLAIADGGTGSSLGSAVPRVVAVVDLTGQSTAIAYTTSLLASAPVGFYRLSYYANVTTAGSAGNSCYFRYGHYDNGGYRNRFIKPVQCVIDNIDTASGAILVDDVNYGIRETVVFYHSSATYHIRYGLSYTETPTAVMDLRLRLEYLGA
jgi:hypothetical protein